MKFSGFIPIEGMLLGTCPAWAIKTLTDYLHQILESELASNRAEQLRNLADENGIMVLHFVLRADRKGPMGERFGPLRHRGEKK